MTLPRSRGRARVATIAVVIGLVTAAVSTGRPAIAEPTSGPNEVVKWNLIAQNTVLAAPPNASAPPAAAVMMAMVQGAVYGAVGAIKGHGRPYLIRHTPGRGESMEAAAATAAFHVLDALFPAQHTALSAQYDDSLAGIPDGNAEQAGIAVGAAAADAMLAEGHDARTGPIPPLPPDDPGFWEPLIVGGTPALDPSPWVALAPTFIVRHATQFRTDGPY